MSAETEIANLLYRYAEYMDAGDFAGAAALFAHARLKVGGGGDGTVDAATMRTLWETGVQRYPDGTPRTKHVVTNPIIEIDETAASCRSYYTVLQQVGDFGLQPIVAGRYHDRFELVDGCWRFVFRDYTMMDMIGDVSRHLQGPIASAGA